MIWRSSKLERNRERDRSDIQLLARAGHLNAETPKDRDHREHRPYLSNEDRHDRTIQIRMSYWD